MKKKITAIILSILMVVTAILPAAFAADEADYTPYRISVSMNGDAGTQKGLCWYTASETDSVVQVYLNGEAFPADVSDVTGADWEGAYMHKVTVKGLLPGKLYTYRVGNGSVWSDIGSFVTDNGDDSFSFIEISDVQASSHDNFFKGAATLQAAFNVCPDAEFVANCGDFTDDSTDEQWNYYDEAFSALNLNTTLVPVAGNHDGLGVWNWFNNMFNLDTSESVQTLNGVNYSFDYGNAHFTVLNTNDVLSVSLSQLQWLKNDMNSTDKDWKIVLMHKSPYTLGKDGKWPDALYLQSSLTKVIDMCGVDLVISGHDHMYLRTKPLKCNRVNENGTTYVLSGTAGYRRYEVRSFLEGMFLKKSFVDALTIQKGGYGNYWDGESWDNTDSENVGGCFNCVSINGGTLTLNSYILSDETGNIKNIDTYSVTKETGKNKATFNKDNTTSDFEFGVGVVPSFACLAAYTLCSWLPRFLVILPKLIYVYATEGTF